MTSAPTVYVVDDDASTRELLAWLMKREGLEVHTFGDPRAFLESYPPGALASACAEAAASLYMVPADATLEHGRLRAEAMLLRDARQEAGSVSDADWATIESLLHRSYLSLAYAVVATNAVAAAP